MERVRIVVVVAAIILLGGALVRALPGADPFISPTRGISMVGPPPKPYSPWGKVFVDGRPAEDGLVVSGLVSGTVRAETETVRGWYALTIVNGRPGDVVSFTVDGLQAPQVGSWASGVSEHIDLYATTCLGDFYVDGIRDLADVMAMIPAWASHEGEERYDVLFDIWPREGPDGYVGRDDMMVVLDLFNVPCP